MIVEIPDDEIKSLTNFINENYEFDFRNYAISSFRRRVSRVLELNKIPDVDHLMSKFINEKSFFEKFISEITVNVTEMFRDPTLWADLRSNIIPGLLKENEKIKIWHAGCSSGEEVYSLAIICEELGVRDRVEVIATDIDKDIIARAQEGAYNVKNMQEVNTNNYQKHNESSVYNLNHYYNIKDGKAYLNKELISHVNYSVHDLVKGFPFEDVDLILCRNVLIYFDQSLQNNVLKMLYESLNKYGYLIIGSKESLIWCDIVGRFNTINNEEKIYKKVK